MTSLEYLQSQRAWAEKWLAVPESDLPGALTHDKVYAVLEQVENDLIDHYGIQWDGKQWRAVLVE